LLRVLDYAIRWFPKGKYHNALRVLRNAEESGNAASSNGLSFARQLISSKTCAVGTPPKGERLVIAGMKSLVERLADGLKILFGEVVKVVKYRAGDVELTTETTTHQADAAVITLPLGVLKKKSVTFDPELPHNHVAAINRLEMGVFNKVILEFPDVAWPEERDFLAMATNNPTIPFFLNLQAYIQRPVLVGIAGGHFGRQIEDCSSDIEVVDKAMRDLRGIIGNKVPHPNRFRVTRWGADPFAFGSYSTFPPVANGLEATALSQPIRDTLFLAGEATHLHDPSTVHGAYWSGQRAAAQITGTRD
jgi:monoamine oxidase